VSLRQKLFDKIQVLNKTIWEERTRKPEVESWLTNFSDSTSDVNTERLHALYLLSHFMYFGSRPMRELMKALYRDLYKYPVIAAIRRAHADTTDTTLIKNLFEQDLYSTRFIGVGNPSESGCHLLYYFRQENGLPKDLFIHTHEIFTRYGRTGPVALRDPDVKRYVFIDDLCGSGEQAVGYSEDILEDLKTQNPDAIAAYCVLFATVDGIQRVKAHTRFDSAQAVFELDDSFKCFGPRSRYFVRPIRGIDRTIAETMCHRYGTRLDPGQPLGFDDCQMLIGFHHNIPDNTLPVIWHTGRPGTPWKPIFRRYPKLYS
jgi:hypothetical protein